jgi:hypothetical protein
MYKRWEENLSRVNPVDLDKTHKLVANEHICDVFYVYIHKYIVYEECDVEYNGTNQIRLQTKNYEE